MACRRLAPTALVTGNFFSVLGVSAQAGRLFRDEETWQSGAAVVVISDRLWRQKLGGKSAIVGTTLSVNGKPASIVGVAPPAFAFPNAGIDVWTPIGWSKEQQALISFRRAHWLRVVARFARRLDRTSVVAVEDGRGAAEDRVSGDQPNHGGGACATAPVSRRRHSASVIRAARGGRVAAGHCRGQRRELAARPGGKPATRARRTRGVRRGTLAAHASDVHGKSPACGGRRSARGGGRLVRCASLDRLRPATARCCRWIA